MSLHLANISPRIRKDEIERVFMRFGSCSVQLRNGYGFVVYDFRGDAEKALRSLNGKKICGESIKLSWSNKQPKQVQRFVRAARTHDVQYGRNSDRGINDVRHNFSRSREDYSVRDKHPDDHRGARKSTEVRNDRGNFNHNDRVEPYNQRQRSLEEGVDYDRREEQHDNLESGIDLNGQTRFDRYEPDNGDEKGEEYKNNASGRLAGSPFRETSLVNHKRVHHHDNLRNHQGCFKCGAAGHKMRDCPLESGSPGKSSYHPDRRLDNQVNTKARGTDAVGGPESRSVGRLRSCSRGSISARSHEADMKPLTVEKNGVKGSSHPVMSESKRKSGKDYKRKRQRQREKEGETFETRDDKKSRISSLPLRSDHMSPELGSHPSVKVLPDSSMRSRSRSPVSHFCSASSMSKSRSNRFRSRSIKSMSRSRSGSPKSSLPISLHGSLSFSPNNADLSLNGSYAGIPSSQSKEVPSELRDQFHSEVREEGLSVPDRLETSLNGCMDNARSHQLKEVLDSKNETPTSISYPELSVSGTLEGDQIPQSENVVLEGELYEPESTQVFRYQITDAPIESEDVSFPGAVIGDVQMDQLHNNDNDNSGVHPVSCEVEVPHPSLLEQGDKNIRAGEFVAEKQREKEELINGNTLEMLKPLEPANKVVHNHLSISKEELCRVLKHYGLKDSEDNAEHLGVEDYFGSARLWPWEMIYYRRLKKGPISMENYARRVAQNKAFGITDKYIRRSSGWGELIDEHS